MKTVKEIEPTKEAVLNYFVFEEFFEVADMFKPGVLSEENIEVKPCHYDSRIGWDTHIVTLKGNAIGFTDGPPKDL